MSQCTAADYTARNTALQKAIHHSEYEELKQGFSETRERDILHAAKQLVKYTSRQLYRDCETKLQAVQQQFATDIATWELRLPKEAEKEKQKQERAVVSAIATQYGIPVLTDMPDGVIAVPLQSGYTAETLQNLTAKHHSPAIVLFSNKEAQLIYDIAPTPRSYSTSPALRTQWQLENEGQNENPAEPIEHSGHDDRFD